MRRGISISELHSRFDVFEQKQTDSHREIKHKEENLVGEGNYMTSRRVPSTYRSEDCPVSTFVLQDPNQRWIVLMPLPFTSPRSKQCSHLASTMPDADSPVLPQPVHLFLIGPHQNHMAHPIESSGSPKSSGHSMEKALKKPHLRNKRSRSLKSTSNEWLPSSHLPNKSDLVCENSNLTVSEALVDDPKVDKTAKRSARKKGKKKGKRCKRSLHKKDLVDTEMLPNKSVHQNTLFSHSPCLDEGISESNSSHNATLSGLSVEVLKENSSEDNNGNHADHVLAAISQTPCSDNMDESPTASFSDEFVGESIHKVGLTIDSCSKNFSTTTPCVPCNIIPPSFLPEDTNISAKNLSSSHCSQINSSSSSNNSCICGPDHIDDDIVQKQNSHIETCTSSSQSCISQRKENHDKKRPVSSNSAYRFPNMNARGGTGKEMSNSFWQRVQKKDVEECSYGPEISATYFPPQDGLGDNGATVKKNSFVSRPIRNQKSCHYPCSDETSAQSNSNTSCSTGTDSNDFQCKPRGGKSMHASSEKFKTKSGLITNLDFTHNFNRKSFHRGRTSDSKSLKVFSQRNELQNKSTTGHYEEVHDSTLLPSCNSSLQSNITACHPSELQGEEGKQTTLEGRPTYGHACFHDRVETTETAQTMFCPMSSRSNSEHSCSLEVLSSRGYSVLNKDVPHYVSCIEDGVKLDTEEICAEHSKQDHYLGSVVQKWIPVEKKHLIHVLNTDQENESGSNKENALEIESAKQHSNTLSDQTSSLLPRSISLQETVFFSTSNTIRQENILKNHASSRNSNFEKKDCILKLDTGLNKIIKVVNDACRSQTISESYQSRTGVPLAEFERVLQSASPAIDGVHNLLCCKSCSSQYQLISDSLCQHQIPNFSLGNLWSWFEKPGTYGLEVKVEDNHLKNMGNARSEFRAYFVPYLSAVQIFSRSNCSSNGKCRNLSTPLSQKEENILSPSRIDSSGTDETCDQSVFVNDQDETELLFEYFESDPPQQRRPLFQKIKELARGDVSSTCKIYGDPSTLEYLHLNDIHPASWYSVSWYPIYRIPDGNFRASFLTYHSLGYFIHRNCDSVPNGRMRIVSPVIGLQNYNSKGECWFQQSEYTKEEPSSLNPSEILKERLRTLEQTASVMARASFRNGGSTVVNKQPDYEFFLSRK